MACVAALALGGFSAGWFQSAPARPHCPCQERAESGQGRPEGAPGAAGGGGTEINGSDIVQGARGERTAGHSPAHTTLERKGLTAGIYKTLPVFVQSVPVPQ